MYSAFGYYTFIREEKPSESVVKAKAELVNPVTVTNVSQELPPLPVKINNAV